MEERMNRTAFWIGKKEDEPKEHVYWRRQPYEKRLKAMEDLRIRFFTYHYGPEYIKQGLQRVYRVIK